MQLLIWITETTTGDIQELNLKGGQKMYFDQKIETYVPVRHDIHYYNFIKRNAQNIQIGITNHAHLIHSMQKIQYINYSTIVSLMKTPITRLCPKSSY